MRVSVQLQVGCRENERKGRGPYGGNHDKYLHGGFEPVVCAMWRALAVIVTRFPTGIKMSQLISSGLCLSVNLGHQLRLPGDHGRGVDGLCGGGNTYAAVSACRLSRTLIGQHVLLDVCTRVIRT